MIDKAENDAVCSFFCRDMDGNLSVFMQDFFKSPQSFCKAFIFWGVKGK